MRRLQNRRSWVQTQYCVILCTGAYGSAIVGCPTFRYMYNGSCHQCPENCTHCVSDTNCTQCKKGFYGPVCENTCGVGCTGPCHNFYGYCTYGCTDGQYPAEKNRCLPCPDHCHVCESESKCFLCEDGQFGVACQETCPERCRICDKNTGQCLQCKTSYFLFDEQCKSCPDGCRACVAESKCTQCTDSYYLYNGQCMTCPHGCSLCNTSADCFTCEDRFVGPINGKCLFNCSSSAVSTYIVPDKNGRCGLWQDTTTNICSGITERHSCSSKGLCLQNVSCLCTADGSCNVKQAQQSVCASVTQYECSHQCQKVFDIIVCKATCSLGEVLTQDVLSIDALTWKNREEAFCQKEQGKLDESLEQICLPIVVTIIIVNVAVIIITIVIVIKRRKLQRFLCHKWKAKGVEQHMMTDLPDNHNVADREDDNSI